jgi:hypothetical protein
MTPNSVQYREWLDFDASMLVWFETDQGKVIEYSVILIVHDIFERNPRTVRVYDNAHGPHHLHRYTPEGLKRGPEVLPYTTPSEALNAARQDLKSRYRGIIDSWRR